MANTFDKSRPHAELTPPWRGAHFKQDGKYFDAAGKLVNVSAALVDQSDSRALIDQTRSNGLEPVVSKDGHSLTWGTHRWLREDQVKALYAEQQSEINELQRQVEALTAPDPDGGEGSGGDLPPNQKQPAAGVPSIESIAEIQADSVARAALRGAGIVTLVELAGLDSDSIAGFAERGVVIKQEWVNEAVAVLAKLNPDAVVKTADPEPPIDSGITKADLVAWAKREGPPRHFGVIRKGMREHFSSAITNETDAVSALIKAGVLTKDEAKR